MNTQRRINDDLTTLNENLYKMVGVLGSRIDTLERGNATIRSYINENHGDGGKDKAVDRKSLVVNDSAESPSSAETAKLQSPAPALLQNTTINTGKKRNYMLNKRPVHDLTAKMPPVMVQFPAVPLTDTELIVFFFNSVSRPIVALRLSSRNWGPSDVTDVLNEHRHITPPYLRNTCCAKSRAAIRRGKDMYGDVWEKDNCEYFASADDAAATDAIRLSGGELDHEVACDVDGLLIDLKKYPEGHGAGIFTQSVKWCAERDVNMNVHLLCKVAAAIKNDTDPYEALFPQGHA